jgi:aspartate racemase
MQPGVFCAYSFDMGTSTWYIESNFIQFVICKTGGSGMKKAGIVGGIGPVSTPDYYLGIINGYRERSQNGDYPEIVIDSINMTEMVEYVSERRYDELVMLLARSVANLEAAGADFAAIASNTPHIVFDEVRMRSKLPLISIVEETCIYAQKAGWMRAAVLGTLFTMQSGMYVQAFERYGINAFVPEAKMQETVHGIIFPNLEDGIVLQEDKKKLLETAEELVRTTNADVLVLGCTELPLAIRQEDISTPVLNTTQIHIDAIVRELLG